MRGYITMVESANDEKVLSTDVILEASRQYRGPLLITSLEVNDGLLARAAQLSGAASLSAAVNTALQVYVELREIETGHTN